MVFEIYYDNTVNVNIAINDEIIETVKYTKYL